MRYATICGVLVAIGVAVGTLTGGGEAQASLLEALKNQAKVKTVRMTVTTVYSEPAPGTPEKEVTKFYGEGGKYRAEKESLTVVYDGKRLLNLNPKTKVGTLTIGYDGKALFAGEPDKDIDQLYLGHVKDVIKFAGGRDKVVAVPPVVIDGKPRAGFKVVGYPQRDLKSDITFWLDAEQQLPLRSETVRNGPKPSTTTSDFFYGEVLDPKLFSFEIPEGYTVQEVTSMVPQKKP